MMRNASAIFFFGAAVFATPLVAQEPDATALFTRADKGHCAACHRLVPATSTSPQADLGPALTGERMRTLGKAALREAIADPTIANPDTVMPPFGRHRILEPREIDRLVDYLLALR